MNNKELRNEDTKCLNGCCGSGKPAAQLEVMGFAEGKPVMIGGYCSERCYREVQGEYCSDILRKFMDRVGPVGDDVGFYVVYDRPDGRHEHLPATFQPGIVDSASRGYRPVGVFGIDSEGNLLDHKCFYPTRVGDETIIADEIAKQQLEHLNREPSLDGIEDLN